MTQIQKYEELGFTNDFMFCKIMQDKNICKPFLEEILGIKIDHIEYLEPQKTIDLKVDAKSVRLDIYVDDGKTVYDCEMQTSFFKNIPLSGLRRSADSIHFLCLLYFRMPVSIQSYTKKKQLCFYAELFLFVDRLKLLII